VRETCDHYPWSDAQEEARAALLRDICGALGTPVPVAPFITPTPAPVQPSRYVKFGDLMICLDCKLAAEWCNCAHRPPADVPSSDGSAESSLEARARACKAGR